MTRRHGPPRMLTTAEVAERFGVCSHTILTWGNSGHLPYTTTTDYHGRWYHSGDVEALVAAGPVRFAPSPAGTIIDVMPWVPRGAS